MNKFEQIYLNIITEWNSNLLLEANLKSLIPNIQDNLLSLLDNKSYNDLTDKQKIQLQSNIDKILANIEKEVNQITDNKQYQSWIYQILKNEYIDYNDLKPIANAIFEFIKLIKRPDLKPEQKNIQNYKTLNDLILFINSFKEEHNLSSNIYKNLKKVYSNQEFTIYFINKDQYEECNKLFGGTEYFNTGWCVAKNKEHFNRYINENPDKYNGYFVFIKENKPYALLHYGSTQFKDASNNSLETDNPNIIDCLYNINDNVNDYRYKFNGKEMVYYNSLIENYKFLKENPTASKEEYIAHVVDGKYDKYTKTINCKGHEIEFKDEYFNDNGTFKFTLTNTSIFWNGMFCNCKKLIKLPNNFLIDPYVHDCSFMFSGCENLIELPKRFTIPDKVTNCSNMFYGCKNLTELPKHFSIPRNCSYNDIFKESGLENKYNPEDLVR